MKDHGYDGLHVYFSASSSNLKKRKPLYSSIIESIRRLGVNLTYNWIADKEVLNSSGVFEKALEGIKTAEVVIAEISYPSIGVGQQITLALNQKIPVIALYQKNEPKVSRFALGMKSPYLTLKQYKIDNLDIILKKSLDEAIKKRFVKFNFISTKEINDYLEKMSSSLNISKSQFLRGIISDQMTKGKHQGPYF